MLCPVLCPPATSYRTISKLTESLFAVEVVHFIIQNTLKSKFSHKKSFSKHYVTMTDELQFKKVAANSLPSSS